MGAANMPDYDITHTHFRDACGKLLWIEPLKNEYRLYEPGESFDLDEIKYQIDSRAIVDNTQHCNISVIS